MPNHSRTNSILPDGAVTLRTTKSYSKSNSKAHPKFNPKSDIFPKYLYGRIKQQLTKSSDNKKHCKKSTTLAHNEHKNNLVIIVTLITAFTDIFIFHINYKLGNDAPTGQLIALFKELLSISDLEKDKKQHQERLENILFGIVQMPNSLVPKWKILCEWARHLRYTDKWEMSLRFGLTAFERSIRMVDGPKANLLNYCTEQDSDVLNVQSRFEKISLS